jgi:cystathionine beta-lyase/cystathionine gamma-synthase
VTDERPRPGPSSRDIPALAEAAHRHGALLTVDNTFASPMVCRPLEAYLERQDGVRSVTHPGLAGDPQADAAARILDTGGAMLPVDLAGGREAGRAFFDAPRIPERTASLGSVHTMVVRPPTISHRSLDAAALAAAHAVLASSAPGATTAGELAAGA